MRTRLTLILVVLSLVACTPGNKIPTTTPPEATPPGEAAPPAYLPSPGIPGQFQTAACRFVLPDGLVEGEDLQCGYLTVEETRGAPQSRLIRLAVAIFHPPGGATQPDPVIYLSGGPGVSALEMIRYQFDILSEAAFATGRDLIVFDQRGVGLSQPALDCPEYDRLSLDLLDHQVNGEEVSEAQTSEIIPDVLRACRERLSQSADLRAYSTAANAADVQDLQMALGFQQVNLWGGSYGTRLALEIMRGYPQGLRSVVLDAVYPPDVDLYIQAPANFKQALTRMFAACQDNQVCSQAFPNLQEVFFDTVDRLNADPVVGEVINPFTGERYKAWMNGNTLLALTFQLLYDSKIRYLIPQYIYAAHQGDYTSFELARGSMIGLMSLSSRGMTFSVLCQDELAFSSYAEYQAEMAKFPEIAGMYTNSILGGLAYQICQEWQVGQADPSANQPVYSQVPTLVMNGEFDPVTPPAWGQHAAETLETAFVYVYPGVGHGAGTLVGCPRQMMTAFLEEPTTAPDDTCITEMQAR